MLMMNDNNHWRPFREKLQVNDGHLDLGFMLKEGLVNGADHGITIVKVAMDGMDGADGSAGQLPMTILLI